MANDLGLTAPALKMMCVNPQRQVLVGPCAAAASDAYTSTGGHFVHVDGSRHIDIAGSGDGNLFGWAVWGPRTTSSVAGTTSLMVDVSAETLYWIPADDTVDITMRGKTCDLIVTSNVQMADVGESNEDVILIQDVDITNQLVLVRIASAARYAEGIA